MKVDKLSNGGVTITLDKAEAQDTRLALLDSEAAHQHPGSERLFAQTMYAAMIAAAEEQPKARTFATKAELANGGGFPCLVGTGCTAITRTLARSQTHATDRTELQSFGHLAK